MTDPDAMSARDLWLDARNSGLTMDKSIREIEKSLTPDAILTKLLDESLDEIFQTHKMLFTPFSELREWIIGFDSHSNKVIKHVHLFRDNEDGMKFLDFLDQLRSKILIHIQNLINDAIVVGRMPPKGIVLYFSEHIRNRIILTYDSRTGRPRVSFVDRMMNVQSLFDLEEIGRLRSQKAKNTAKSFLQSGHKAVMHYGVITHVDRRRHFEVFGPSIDTLHIADILLSSKFVRSVRSILEIGVGSGHIICSAIRNIGGLTYVDAVDVNPFSILCTIENMRKIIGLDGLSISPDDLTLSIGKFSKEKFTRKYDLVICNPPYVTLPPRFSKELESDYALATVGTKLIEETLDALPDLLRPCGRCLMMVSSATLEFETMVPTELQISPAQGDRTIRVPFDVEAVNNNREFLKYLVSEEGIEHDESRGQYTHRLRPFWIEVRQ